MQSSLRRIGCFALVFVLILTIFAAPPAEAVFPIAIGAVAALVALCGMIGITFATTDAAKEAAQMVSAYDDLWEDINSIYIPPSGGPGMIEISAATTALVGTILYRLKGLFAEKGDGTVLVDDATIMNFRDVVVTVNATTMTTEQLFASAPYSVTDAKTIYLNSSPYAYKVNLTNSYYYAIQLNNQNCAESSGGSYGLQVAMHNDYVALKNIDVRWGFYPHNRPDGSLWLNPYIVGRGSTTLGIVTYKSSLIPVVYRGQFPISAEQLEPSKKELSYAGRSRYAVKDVVSGIEKLVADQGTITLPITDIETAIETETDEDIDKDHDYFVDLLPGLKELLEKNRIDTEESIGDLNPPTLDGDSLLDKFPFCVPKDLYLLVTALQAPAEAPHWTIPIKFDVVDFYEEYEFDLSRFDQLATAIRWGLTLIFLAGLIMVSRKMIKG